MRLKYLLLLPLLICGHGFLPLSFRFDKNAVKNPNTLLIQHQECGCPCPDAYIKEGQLIIPKTIQNSYVNIDERQINMTGNDPFDPYEPELAMQDIRVSGEIVGVDTVLCDQSGCEVVPVFKVNEWHVDSYYPRLWTYSKTFLIIFLISVFLSGIIILLFVGTGIKKRLTRRTNSIA